jgi:hypothetical protein
MIWKEVFLQSLEVREKLCQEFLHNGGIKDQTRYLNINPVRVNMSMEP